jgi:predicted SAM-dependent methyltransferase
VQLSRNSWKPYAKRALKPVVAPVLNRLSERVAHQLRVQGGEPLLSQHLPALLNSISIQNAAARETRRAEIQLGEELANVWTSFTSLAERIGDVEKRGEFIRREVLVSLRQQGSSNGIVDIVEPRIVRPEKVASMSPLRVNLGCGHIPREGYVNVDARELPSVDVVADARRLPFDPGTVAEIYTAHMLEHFPLDDLERVVLPHWREQLEAGGVLHVVVPDAGSMLDEYGAGQFSFDDLRLVTFGDQEYEGDFHYTMFTADSLVELLERVGFGPVKVIETGRRNGACLEMELSATKPLLEPLPAPATS